MFFSCVILAATCISKEPIYAANSDCKYENNTDLLYSGSSEEIIDNVTTAALQMENKICEDKIAIRAVGHYCGYDKWNLDTACRQNYNTIKDFYNSMVKAQQSGTSVDPWLSTASYWVGLVREKGLCDYKEQLGYKYYCCTVGGVAGQDRMTEWIGQP